MSKHILLKSPKELDIMRENGKILAGIFLKVKDYIKGGISTKDIDTLVKDSISDHGGKPSFLGYGSFPGSICASVNDVVIHGIPNEKNILKEGDIISVDIGFYKNGFHVDSANTFGVGTIEPKAQKLLEDTKESLNKAIAILKPQKTLFDIANNIQSFLEPKGYGLVRDFVGHGVGKDLHEAPQVPNVRQGGLSKVRLSAGMVIAIEPMVTLGSPNVLIEKDEWTVRTIDHSLAAHFEHTVAITPTGHEILTTL